MKIPQQIVGQMSKNQHRAMLKICIMQHKPTERGPSLHDIRTWYRRVEVSGQATMGLMQKRYLQWTLQSTERISSFYRASYASAVLGVVILSVCPSVRRSVCHTRALWLIQRTYTGDIFIPHERAVLLVKCDFSYSCAAADKISTDLRRRAVPLR